MATTVVTMVSRIAAMVITVTATAISGIIHKDVQAGGRPYNVQDNEPADFNGLCFIYAH